jgi:hypothetical protein
LRQERGLYHGEASPGTRLGMIALRSYLVVGALLLVVKAVQLSGR